MGEHNSDQHPAVMIRSVMQSMLVFASFVQSSKHTS